MSPRSPTLVSSKCSPTWPRLFRVELLAPLFPERQAPLEALALGLQHQLVGAANLCPGVIQVHFRHAVVGRLQEVALEIQQLLVDPAPMLGVIQLFGLGILPEEQPVEIGGLLSGTLVARLVPVLDSENLPLCDASRSGR